MGQETIWVLLASVPSELCDFRQSPSKGSLCSVGVGDEMKSPSEEVWTRPCRIELASHSCPWWPSCLSLHPAAGAGSAGHACSCVYHYLFSRRLTVRC
jgi:hypothetical protein